MRHGAGGGRPDFRQPERGRDIAVASGRAPAASFSLNTNVSPVSSTGSSISTTSTHFSVSPGANSRVPGTGS